MESEKQAGRFRTLPQEQRRVGLRVGDVRRFYRYSQDFCAKAVHLTRNQLANIESGRVPLKFWTGWRLCEFLKINQYWLATGLGPEEPFLPIDLRGVGSLTEETLFRDACTGPLKGVIFEFEESTGSINRFYEEEKQLKEFWRKAFDEIEEECAERVPLSERLVLARRFLVIAKKFFRDAEKARLAKRKR